ncbi:VC0807 family protein [Streptomyces sp. NPDC048581]|uniref:VC0807 family protein n=1 Tax=Streptomyces sp. NPDC048581 TaxID=3365572 RepID=UPI003720890B
MTTQTRKKTRKQDTFGPLIVDVAVPVGSYYLFKEAFGASTFAALALSSVVPAVRTVWCVVKERRVNALAGLILVVNAVSLLLSFVSGDPRLMLAKDSGVSSAIGLAVLVSVVVGRPMLTAGFKPFLVQGDPAREAAWERLVGGSVAGAVAFVRAERVFSVVWGVVLLVECVVRVVGAYTVPVDTMVWLGSVILIGSMAVAFVVSRAVAAKPMARLLIAEVKAAEAAARAGVAVVA